MTSKWWRAWMIGSLPIAAIGIAPSSSTAEKIYYSYDALGRLYLVCNALPGKGDLTQYSLDGRDNRTTYSNQDQTLYLANGASQRSPGKIVKLAMRQNGNLVLVQVNSDGTERNPVLWETSTTGTGSNTYAAFQSDGNLVVYGPNGPVWSSGTSSPCARLSIQDTGYIAIYDTNNQLVWKAGKPVS